MFGKPVAGRSRKESSCSAGSPAKYLFEGIRIQLSERELRAEELECEGDLMEGVCLESPEVSASRIVERSFGIKGSGEGLGCRGA